MSCTNTCHPADSHPRTSMGNTHETLAKHNISVADHFSAAPGSQPAFITAVEATDADTPLQATGAAHPRCQLLNQHSIKDLITKEMIDAFALSLNLYVNVNDAIKGREHVMDFQGIAKRHFLAGLEAGNIVNVQPFAGNGFLSPTERTSWALHTLNFVSYCLRFKLEDAAEGYGTALVAAAEWLHTAVVTWEQSGSELGISAGTIKACGNAFSCLAETMEATGSFQNFLKLDKEAYSKFLRHMIATGPRLTRLCSLIKAAEYASTATALAAAPDVDVATAVADASTLNAEAKEFSMPSMNQSANFNGGKEVRTSSLSAAAEEIGLPFSSSAAASNAPAAVVVVVNTTKPGEEEQKKNVPSQAKNVIILSSKVQRWLPPLRAYSKENFAFAANVPVPDTVAFSGTKAALKKKKERDACRLDAINGTHPRNVKSNLISNRYSYSASVYSSQKRSTTAAVTGVAAAPAVVAIAPSTVEANQINLPSKQSVDTFNSIAAKKEEISSNFNEKAKEEFAVVPLNTAAATPAPAAVTIEPAVKKWEQNLTNHPDFATILSTSQIWVLLLRVFAKKLDFYSGAMTFILASILLPGVFTTATKSFFSFGVSTLVFAATATQRAVSAVADTVNAVLENKQKRKHDTFTVGTICPVDYSAQGENSSCFLREQEHGSVSPRRVSPSAPFPLAAPAAVPNTKRAAEMDKENVAPQASTSAPGSNATSSQNRSSICHSQEKQQTASSRRAPTPTAAAPPAGVVNKENVAPPPPQRPQMFIIRDCLIPLPGASRRGRSANHIERLAIMNNAMKKRILREVPLDFSKVQNF